MTETVTRPEPNRFARKQVWTFRGKGPNGRNLCFCGCGREVVKPRISCYSDECLAWYRSHSDPATIRSIVETRDKAICALCRMDCELDRRIAEQTRLLWLWLARREAEDLFWAGNLPRPKWHEGHEIRTYGECYDWAVREVTADMKARGWDFYGGGHTWEADHIIPVIEGGGGCGPEGYRTLCLACHKVETAKLAARRAVARKQKPAPESAG